MSRGWRQLSSESISLRWREMAATSGIAYTNLHPPLSLHMKYAYKKHRWWKRVERRRKTSCLTTSSVRLASGLDVYSVMLNNSLASMWSGSSQRPTPYIAVSDNISASLLGTRRRVASQYQFFIAIK